MSIKQFVFRCLDKGMSDKEAWDATRDQYYPLRIVGWGYVQRLAKQYRLSRQAPQSSRAIARPTIDDNCKCWDK